MMAHKPDSRIIRGMLLALTVAAAAFAMRRPGEEIRPGFNLFSKQQDIQIGEHAAAQVRRQFPAIKSQDLQDYLRRIGERLAAQRRARESGFTFTFTLLNDKAVNAFALPGGHAFVFTGLMRIADNEAQVAGVLGHEMAHVILRHGTNQASKANLMQLPALLAGALTGSELVAQLTNLGVFPLLLKFSRTDESEADALGARLMNEAGYNPVEMARFFERLQAETEHVPELLSDHPDPGNRVRAVEAEIRALPRATYSASAGDFAREKALVLGLPPHTRQTSVPSRLPSLRPSGGFRQLRGREFALSYPDNWQVLGDRDAATITIAPREGLVETAGRGRQIGYGAIISYYFPEESPPPGLARATGELVRRLQASNPSLRLSSTARRSITVESSAGLVTRLTNESPFPGESEIDMLVTIDRPQGLFYALFIAPKSEFPSIEEAFNEMIHSLRFSN